jgi:hypothetical protein
MSETAPLCFGALTFYSVNADRCKQCIAFAACGPQVQETIVEVSRALDIDALMEKHHAAKRRPANFGLQADPGRLKTQAPAVERNVKFATVTATPSDEGTRVEILEDGVKPILLGMMKEGTFAELREDIQAGKNPFPRSMQAEFLLCELLLRGRSTRAEIESTVSRLGASPEKIKSLRHAFSGSKLATMDKSGGLTINKE